ncbi:MAG: NAD(P)-binding domain-containing protein [Myxococcales bacterium]|nr:NAD(P)-binding domain-containing protein [Myxococcales bacterium]
MNSLTRYAHWLHTRWPAGLVEKMPEVGPGGTTQIPGVRVVGDLTGVPLLKFSVDTGAKAVIAFMEEPDFAKQNTDEEVYDLVIIGAGVSGMSAALEAQNHGLKYVVFEAAERFNTIINFPKEKPIYTYPSTMIPAGHLQLTASVKETLVEELANQTKHIEVQSARIDRVERRGQELLIFHADATHSVTRSKHVIIAIGRSGNYRSLGISGQDLDKVYHRLYDPAEYQGQDVLVVGGGDSALESAIALTQAGAKVTLSYRKPVFDRPKPANIEQLKALEQDPRAAITAEPPVSDQVNAVSRAFAGQPNDRGTITCLMGSKILKIGESSVNIVNESGTEQEIPNQVVFAMIGREAPLDFFRKSGISITGEWGRSTWVTFLGFLAFCVFVYHWKSGGFVTKIFQNYHWFPYNIAEILQLLDLNLSDPATLMGTLAITLRKPGFYYTLAYTIAIVMFGIDRIRRKRTQYILIQTSTLIFFQLIPLFFLPYLILPYLGHNGFFDDGVAKTIADNLFPIVSYSHGREYWRAFGLVLAWPLFVWNFFTADPMIWWLVIGGVQTFVIIPVLVYFFGKGAYCGWICSCGALAETLGDRHRHKMPHGPFWNRLNMVGQIILIVCFLMFAARILAWNFPHSPIGSWAGKIFQITLDNYAYLVDLWLAGVVGVSAYFWFSGRVWCRFACPLAALMHIYARFSRFRIFSEKQKCISCNVCTSVCHQGIDVMSFANKGLPMEDPECVRCSACVEQCPTGVLSFGRYVKSDLIALDTLKASTVRTREQ